MKGKFAENDVSLRWTSLNSKVSKYLFTTWQTHTEVYNIHRITYTIIRIIIYGCQLNTAEQAANYNDCLYNIGYTCIWQLGLTIMTSSLGLRSTGRHFWSRSTLFKQCSTFKTFLEIMLPEFSPKNNKLATANIARHYWSSSNGMAVRSGWGLQKLLVLLGLPIESGGVVEMDHVKAIHQAIHHVVWSSCIIWLLSVIDRPYMAALGHDPRIASLPRCVSVQSLIIVGQTSIRAVIRRKNWAPRLSGSFKVNESDTDRSGTHIFLLVMPIWYRSRDERRFRSNNANTVIFPLPSCIKCSQRGSYPSELGYATPVELRKKK